MATQTTTKAYSALVLAGGESRRMDGQDKGLQCLNGEPLYLRALSLLKQQTPPPSQLLISANRNLADYQRSGFPILTDYRLGFNGPLAGIEAGLKACNEAWLLCIPCDMPQLPCDLASKLFSGITLGGKAAYAVTNDGPQPVCCLLHRTLLASLENTLNQGQRRVIAWLNDNDATPVHFADAAAFRNVNTLSDLTQIASGSPT